MAGLFDPRRGRLAPRPASPRGEAQGVGSAAKETAAFWRAVKSGDYVSLSDEEAFDEAIAGGAAGAAVPGAPAGGAASAAREGSPSRGFAVDYRVGEIRRFALRGPEDFRAASFGRSPARRAGPAGEYRFIELSRAGEGQGSGPLYLALVEKTGESPDFELRLYFIPAGLEPGTRDDWIDSGDSWLFLPPQNPEDFISSELEYAPYPDLPEIEEGGRSVKRVFARAGPGELYAEALDTEAPVIIVEYEAEPGAGGDEAANPLMLVLEEGWMRPDGSEPEEGGYLTMMFGKVMRTSDIEHWPA